VSGGGGTVPLGPEATSARNDDRLRRRVVDAAEAALAERKHVSAIDVLAGLGWLPPSRVDEWRQGRVDHLEDLIQAGPRKVDAAVAAFRGWAQDRGLVPSEAAYVARTRDRRALRFSNRGDTRAERAYRTHWLSPDLSEGERAKLAERQSRAPELVVIEPLGDWECAHCGGSGGLLLMEEPGPVCMACADLDHLVFLAAGDAALTRRARKSSGLSAVVVRFSRARKRYERQGVLVDEAALEQAETECFADADARARRREREQSRRALEDEDFQAALAREIARLYPGCPVHRAREIARHAGARGSGRVGRSAAGQAFEPRAIELAIVASIRHVDTSYDELLMAGLSRIDAREHVRHQVDRVLEEWAGR
jgi:hypothetical protein